MAWTAAATVDDEGFHPRNDDPWWNESSFLTFRVPELDLLGILYFYFRPNQNTAMGGPIILDPTSEDLATCRHAGWGWHMPIPEGADMFDFALANGFSSQTLQPGHSYRHTYQAAGCAFDLTYTADGPPMVMADKKAGLSDFVDDTDQRITTGHFEQFGVINGVLELDDEIIEVHDAGAFRDRSWGPRPVLQAQEKPRGALVFARAGADHAFQAWISSGRPWTDDPIDDTQDTVVSGFYVRDGRTGRLINGTRGVLERAPSGRPLREVVEATDEHGRTLHAEGRVTAGIRWPGLYGDITALWCHEHWTIDGQPASGEAQEWIMARHFARWHHLRRSNVG